MGLRFEGKAAIVTGSSSGIGKATALRIAEEGAAVCVVANRNAEGGNRTVEEITAQGGNAVFVQADVSIDAGCRRIVDATLEAFGRIDVLVNNAGITRRSALADLDEDLWDLVHNTNLKSAYMMSRHAAPDMLQRGSGSIVNISSVHALATYPGSAVYAASKAGLCGLTRGLALELGPQGVRVNCVIPGTIDISLFHPDNREADRDTWQPRASEAQILNRCGSPHEVAAAILFLAADEASFINGEALVVDGGQLRLYPDGHGVRVVRPTPGH